MDVKDLARAAPQDSALVSKICCDRPTVAPNLLLSMMPARLARPLVELSQAPDRSNPTLDLRRRTLNTLWQIMGGQTCLRRWASLLALVPTMCFGQAIAVPASETSIFGTAPPTMTFLFEAKDAGITLVFVPGGGGNFGIQPDWTEEHRHFSYHFNRMLRTLTDPKTTSGRTNLVIFDNPTDMPFRRGWSGARTTPEHLSRVEDVVRFYGDKLGQPVWLMGHSAGAISITELYKRLQSKKQERLVAGLIYSAGIFGASFDNASTRLPVLVIHHEKDECVSTKPANAIDVYTGLKEAGNLDAELAMLSTGRRSPNGQDPCTSGFHMYLGANAEASRAIDQFIAKHLTPR